MKITHVPLDALKGDPDNPNVTTKKQREQIKASIERYGLVQPFVVDHEHQIINGHQRWVVIKQYEELATKHRKIPCYVCPPDMSAEDKMLLQQALNKVHGQHDIAKDSAIFERLLKQERGSDLAALLGKKPDTISKLIQRTKDAAEGITSHDTTTGKCKVGETWALGRHILHVGDCQTYHKEAQKEDIALLLTDPPYGISVVKDCGTVGGGKGGAPKSMLSDPKSIPSHQYAPVAGDDKPFDPAPLLNIKTGTTIMFGSHAYASRLPEGTIWLIWTKKNPDAYRKWDTSDAEIMWTSRKGKGVHAYHHLWNGLVNEGKKVERVHPTQKPVELLRDIIQDYSKEGDLVYDPYLGSGSTLMACELSGRTCIGVELSPEYCELIIKRFESHAGVKAEKVKSA